MSENEILETLQFQQNEANEGEGINHYGIQTYKSSPYASIARECSQNSADASQQKPVKISFDQITIKAHDLPAIDHFKSTISSCLDKAKNSNDEKAISFFNRAKKVIESDDIQVLRIADYNTTGLIGPCEEGTPFYSLLKGAGVSKKETDTAGGSFGIGKNAAFTISELQTVFYSTLYEAPGEKDQKFLAQGKTILISHTNEEGLPVRGTGYWGNSKYLPVSKTDSVPEWLKRSDIGTSLCVIGFRNSVDWQYRMTASIISNFFFAILNGDMEFSLNNEEIKISKDNLEKLFKDTAVIKAAKDSGELEALEFASNLYKCLLSEDTNETIIYIKNIGKISIRVLVSEGLEKRVAIARNGMVITDNLSKFGESFRIFQMCDDFICLVNPVDNEGNSFIRKLENPSHNELSAESITNNENRSIAIKAMKLLGKEVRKCIKQQTLVVPEDETDLEELSEFFADSNDNDDLPDPKADENPETYKYTPPKRPKKKEIPTELTTNPVGENGGSEYEEGTGTGKIGKGDGTGDGDSGSGNQSFIKPTHLADLRNLSLIENGKLKRKILFTPKETCQATLQIKATGIMDSEILSIKESPNYNMEDNKIFFSLEKGKRMSILVQFSDDYKGPIEVVAMKSTGG